MSDPRDLLEADAAAATVFLGDEAIPPLAPSETEGSAGTPATWTDNRGEDPLRANRYDVPFASTDAPVSNRMDTSPRSAGRRWQITSSAAEFYPRVAAGAPTRNEGRPVTAERTPPRHRLASLVMVTLLLAAVLGAFAISTVGTFPHLRLGTATGTGPQRVPAAAHVTSITVPRTATTGRGYVLTVPAGFGAESPALDGSDVSLVSATSGTFFGVVSHAGSAKPALLVTGTPVHTRIAGIAASGVTATLNGRVTRAVEFRHDHIWYVVTQSADAPDAASAFATLSKTLQDWRFSALGA